MRECLVSIAVIDKGTTIVLAVTIVVAIAQLHIGAVCNGFAIGHLSLPTIVLGRSVEVAIVLLFCTLCIIGNVGCRQLLVTAITIVSAKAQSDVAPLIIQLAISLQLALEVGIGAIANTAIRVAVYHDVSQLVDNGFVRVGTIRSIHAVASSSVTLIGNVRTEDDVGHGVGLPFETEITRQSLV